MDEVSIILSCTSQFMANNMTIFLVSVVFIALDIITGIAVALIDKDYSSTILRKGLAHKLGYIFIMCSVAIIQIAMFDPNFTIDFEFPLFNVVCAFIIFMEFSSILENACKLNPDLNEFVGKYFKFNNNDFENDQS